MCHTKNFTKKISWKVFVKHFAPHKTSFEQTKIFISLYKLLIVHAQWLNIRIPYLKNFYIIHDHISGFSHEVARVSSW